MLDEFLFSYSTTFSLVFFFSSFVWGRKLLLFYLGFFVLPSRFCALLLIILGGVFVVVLFFLIYRGKSAFSPFVDFEIGIILILAIAIIFKTSCINSLSRGFSAI